MSSYGWYNGDPSTLSTGYARDRLRLSGFGRGDAETLSVDVLTNLVTKCQAELDRRKLVETEKQIQERRAKQAAGWAAFSNFLLGAIHALSAHRSLQRHTSLFGPSIVIGGSYPVGSYWTQLEIGKARRSYSLSEAREKGVKNGIPNCQYAAWERTVAEHKAYMLRKLEIEKAQKPKPLSPNNAINSWRSYTP